MRLGSMVTTIIGNNEARQPTVRLRFGFGFVEMVERLVRILDRAEWPLDLALGARRRSPTIGAGGHVGYDLNAEAFHHSLEHRRLRDRSVVQVDRVRDSLERIALALLSGDLERHGVEQKTQCRLSVFAV